MRYRPKRRARRGRPIWVTALGRSSYPTNRGRQRASSETLIGGLMTGMLPTRSVALGFVLHSQAERRVQLCRRTRACCSRGAGDGALRRVACRCAGFLNKTLANLLAFWPRRCWMIAVAWVIRSSCSANSSAQEEHHAADWRPSASPVLLDGFAAKRWSAAASRDRHRHCPEVGLPAREGMFKAACRSTSRGPVYAVRTRAALVAATMFFKHTGQAALRLR